MARLSPDSTDKTYTPLYVAEACWKYNHRKDDNAFGSFMRECFA